MKLLWYLKRPFPLRQQLILTIGLILLVFQLTNTSWLWHGSTEQMQLFEQALCGSRNNDRHIMYEIREAITDLVVSDIFMVSLTLLIYYQAVWRITRPLAGLQKKLGVWAADNLTPIKIHSSTVEIQAAVLALNDLATQLTSTIENERLFIVNVAHEPRTLLSDACLHLELLFKTHKVDVTPLITCLDQMVDSVSQLLQLTHAGQSLPAESYQHAKLLEDAILPPHDELSAMLDQRKQILPLLQSTADVVIRGDTTLSRMLLRNLVENAHRYSPGGTHIMIGLNIEHDAVLAVEDERSGTDESKCGGLSKAPVHTDSRFSGVGLELSTISCITQLHHRHLYLQNRQGVSGTRVWVGLAKDQ